MSTILDIATCMHRSWIDPFTGQDMYVGKQLRDRRTQRALLQFFKPENWFEVRRALLDAGQGISSAAAATP